jgi:hypothetical protein
MIDEHGLHPDVTPAVAVSLQTLSEDETKRAATAAREKKKMRRVFAIAVATAIILASLGVVMVTGNAPGQRTATSGATATVASVAAGVGIDARRTEILRRIDEARNGGHLKGVVYMALVSDHQSVLVGQRRAEAHGMPDADVKKLHADLDRMAAQLERHLKSH